MLPSRVIFGTFQVINGLSSVGLFVAPRRLHESTFKNPQEVYKNLGFSAIAQEMLHNVLRCEGAALLAISAFLAYLGPKDRNSFLLIGLTCGFATISHVTTAQHHLHEPSVMEALGGDLNALYITTGLSVVIGAAGLWVFFDKNAKI